MDCANHNINTTNENGKMIGRILISVSQQEIERTIEKTKTGYAWVIKAGHISHQIPLEYVRKDKTLVPGVKTKDIVTRIFNMYYTYWIITSL